MGIIHVLPDSTQKIVIRQRTDRKLYYSKFLIEQDIRMKVKMIKMIGSEKNNLKK